MTAREDFIEHVRKYIAYYATPMERALLAPLAKRLATNAKRDG